MHAKPHALQTPNSPAQSGLTERMAAPPPAEPPAVGAGMTLLRISLCCPNLYREYSQFVVSGEKFLNVEKKKYSVKKSCEPTQTWCDSRVLLLDPGQLCGKSTISIFPCVWSGELARGSTSAPLGGAPGPATGVGLIPTADGRHTAPFSQRRYFESTERSKGS